MDFSAGGNSTQRNAVIERVQKEYAWNGGSCIQLDKLIKDIRDRIVSEKIKPTPYNYTFSGGTLNKVALQVIAPELYIQALINQKAVLEVMFASNGCSDKIETLRQNESAVLITKQAIEQEKAVLKASSVDQNIYIGVGALILLVGVFIVVKK